MLYFALAFIPFFLTLIGMLIGAVLLSTWLATLWIPG
jgi:hypothetical protein